MKYVYVCAGICLLLFGTHLYAFKTGYAAGGDKIKSELQGIAESQAAAIVSANQKILDLQRVIGNNNDECFNRVWDAEIVLAVNPALKEKQ